MSEEGKLFDFANLDVVDEWSRAAYLDFESWPLAQAGRWSTWSGAPYYQSNYLLLDLTVVSDGQLAEPACIYTADDELTFATRAWHDHGWPDTDAHVYIKDLAERWFRGDFFIAAYYNGEDWKGTKTINKSSDLRAELLSGLTWVRQSFDADRVAVMGPYESADRVFAISASGIEF